MTGNRCLHNTTGQVWSGRYIATPLRRYAVTPVRRYTVLRPDLVDAALLRPGRFDRLIHVTLPDEGARRQVLLRTHCCRGVTNLF